MAGTRDLCAILTSSNARVLVTRPTRPPRYVPAVSVVTGRYGKSVSLLLSSRNERARAFDAFAKAQLQSRTRINTFDVEIPA